MVAAASRPAEVSWLDVMAQCARVMAQCDDDDGAPPQDCLARINAASGAAARRGLAVQASLFSCTICSDPCGTAVKLVKHVKSAHKNHHGAGGS